MDQTVSVFPNQPESMMESFEPKVGENPLDAENDRHVGNDGKGSSLRLTQVND